MPVKAGIKSVATTFDGTQTDLTIYISIYTVCMDHGKALSKPTPHGKHFFLFIIFLLLDPFSELSKELKAIPFNDTLSNFVSSTN